MKKNLNNMMLGISLLFIFCISVYFIAEKMKAENIGHYLDLLGQKLMAALPEDTEKEEIVQLYDQFKQQVEERKVSPEQVEKTAAEILNLENWADSLRVVKAEESIALALGGISVADPLVPPEVPVVKSPYQPRPGDEKKWRELGSRLKEVYIVDNNLKRLLEQKLSEQGSLYEYSDSLHLIIDQEIKQDLLLDATDELLETVKELEQQNRLIWKEGKEEELAKKMWILQDSLRILKYNLDTMHRAPEIIVHTPDRDSVVVKAYLLSDSAYRYSSSKKRIK